MLLETVKELLLVTGRIATIFPLLLLIALYMGKRSIGELPVFDFLVEMLELATAVAKAFAADIVQLPTGDYMVIKK